MRSGLTSSGSLRTGKHPYATSRVVETPRASSLLCVHHLAPVDHAGYIPTRALDSDCYIGALAHRFPPSRNFIFNFRHTAVLGRLYVTPLITGADRRPRRADRRGRRLLLTHQQRVPLFSPSYPPCSTSSHAHRHPQGVFPSGGRLPTIIHLIGKGTRGFSPSYIQTESLVS